MSADSQIEPQPHPASHRNVSNGNSRAAGVTTNVAPNCDVNALTRKQLNFTHVMILNTTSLAILWMPTALTAMFIYFQVIGPQETSVLEIYD
jgi:hypothetical protein